MTDERTIAYLLEELTEREAEEFEEQCFAQAEWPEVELEAAEEDLIQAYLRKELSPERQRRFEEKYLTTEARKERVLLARSFLHVACSEMAAPPQLTWRQWLRNLFIPQSLSPWEVLPRAAAVVVAACLVVSLVWLTTRTRAPQTFASLGLVIAAENRSDTRSSAGPVKKVTLPIAEDALRISLTLPEQPPQGATYRVQWEDLNGPIEDLRVEKQDTHSLTVIIASKKLKPGQYTLKLYRKNPDGTERRVPGNYHFDIE